MKTNIHKHVKVEGNVDFSEFAGKYTVEEAKMVVERMKAKIEDHKLRLRAVKIFEERFHGQTFTRDEILEMMIEFFNKNKFM